MVTQGMRVYDTLRLAEMDGFKRYDRADNGLILVRRAKDPSARPNQTRFELAYARK